MWPGRTSRLPGNPSRSRQVRDCNLDVVVHLMVAARRCLPCDGRRPLLTAPVTREAPNSACLADPMAGTVCASPGPHGWAQAAHDCRVRRLRVQQRGGDRCGMGPDAKEEAEREDGPPGATISWSPLPRGPGSPLGSTMAASPFATSTMRIVLRPLPAVVIRLAGRVVEARAMAGDKSVANRRQRLDGAAKPSAGSQFWAAFRAMNCAPVKSRLLGARHR